MTAIARSKVLYYCIFTFYSTKKAGSDTVAVSPRPNVVAVTLSLVIIPLLSWSSLFDLCFPLLELGKDGGTIRFLLQISCDIVYTFPRNNIGILLLKLNQQRANRLFIADRLLIERFKASILHDVFYKRLRGFRQRRAEGDP